MPELPSRTAGSTGDRVGRNGAGVPFIGETPVGPDIQVVGRCASVLRLFTPARTSLRIGDLEAELEMQRSTAHRYLTSLAAAGFLEQADGGGYVLGPLVAQVGTIALDSQRVLDVADPFLRHLAAETQQTTVLSLWGGMGPVVARVMEDMEQVVHIQVRIGTTLAIDSAQGLVFLAFLHDQAAAARALHHLPVPILESIEAEVESVQATGLSIRTTPMRGVRTVAAPVLDRRSRIHAAMGVVGTTSTIPEDRESGLAQALRAAVQGLSEQLGRSSTSESLDPTE